MRRTPSVEALRKAPSAGRNWAGRPEGPVPADASAPPPGAPPPGAPPRGVPSLGALPGEVAGRAWAADRPRPSSVPPVPSADEPVVAVTSIAAVVTATQLPTSQRPWQRMVTPLGTLREPVRSPPDSNQQPHPVCCRRRRTSPFAARVPPLGPTKPSLVPQ